MLLKWMNLKTLTLRRALFCYDITLIIIDYLLSGEALNLLVEKHEHPEIVKLSHSERNTKTPGDGGQQFVPLCSTKNAKEPEVSLYQIGFQ